MHKYLFVVLCLFGSLQSSAQMSVTAQSGLGSVPQDGFRYHLKSGIGIGWQLTDKWSWGFTYDIMKATFDQGVGSFKYCDTILFDGTNKPCPLGHDSLVRSSYLHLYNHSSYGVYAMFKSDSTSQWTVYKGIHISIQRFQRNLRIDDRLFSLVGTLESIGYGLQYMHRIENNLLKENDWVKYFVDVRVGMFYSPGKPCIGINCDNFLEKPVNFIGNLQFGIRLELN